MQNAAQNIYFKFGFWFPSIFDQKDYRRKSKIKKEE